jgi:hypothetical protein
MLKVQIFVLNRKKSGKDRIFLTCPITGKKLSSTANYACLRTFTKSVVAIRNGQ